MRTPEPCFRNSLRDGEVGCMDLLCAEDCTLGLLDRTFQAPRGCCAIARRYKVKRASPSIRERRDLHSGGHHQDGVPDMNDAAAVHRAGRFHLHHVSPIGEHLDLHAAGRSAACEAGMIRSFAPQTTSAGTFDDASTSWKSRPACRGEWPRLAWRSISTPERVVCARPGRLGREITLSLSLSSRGERCATQAWRGAVLAARRLECSRELVDQVSLRSDERRARGVEEAIASAQLSAGTRRTLTDECSRRRTFPRSSSGGQRIGSSRPRTRRSPRPREGRGARRSGTHGADGSGRRGEPAAGIVHVGDTILMVSPECKSRRFPDRWRRSFDFIPPRNRAATAGALEKFDREGLACSPSGAKEDPCSPLRHRAGIPEAGFRCPHRGPGILVRSDRAPRAQQGLGARARGVG